jgi:alanine dehydrogenase
VDNKITIGLPQMYKEPGEKRDFLPNFVAWLSKQGAKVLLEYDYGAEMGYKEGDYQLHSPTVRFVSHKETYRQEYVMVLRYPTDDEVRQMHPGACLISMLHYPTRPQRVAFLQAYGLEGISLDGLKDDSGRRLVENLREVAWNGIETAFKTLRKNYPDPGFDHHNRPPLNVTLLGAGAIGSNVVRAAVSYGDENLRKELAAKGVPGVKVTVVDYDLTNNEDEMHNILKTTDILVDATQRPDPSRPVIPNKWVGLMPQHAVLLDLSVDPYNLTNEPIHVKGIEGMPQGNLDQYVFGPDDPAYDQIPEGIPTDHRRFAVSCYSWPGIYPKRCMEIYGHQLRPIMHVLIEKGGIQNINPNGRYFERAIARAQLSRWGIVESMDKHRQGTTLASYRTADLNGNIALASSCRLFPLLPGSS